MDLFPFVFATLILEHRAENLSNPTGLKIGRWDEISVLLK